MRKKYTRPTLRKTGKLEKVTLNGASPQGSDLADPDLGGKVE